MGNDVKKRNDYMPYFHQHANFSTAPKKGYRLNPKNDNLSSCGTQTDFGIKTKSTQEIMTDPLDFSVDSYIKKPKNIENKSQADFQFKFANRQTKPKYGFQSQQPTDELFKITFDFNQKTKSIPTAASQPFHFVFGPQENEEETKSEENHCYSDNEKESSQNDNSGFSGGGYSSSDDQFEEEQKESQNAKHVTQQKDQLNKTQMPGWENDHDYGECKNKTGNNYTYDFNNKINNAQATNTTNDFNNFKYESDTSDSLNNINEAGYLSSSHSDKNEENIYFGIDYESNNHDNKIDEPMIFENVNNEYDVEEEEEEEEGEIEQENESNAETQGNEENQGNEESQENEENLENDNRNSYNQDEEEDQQGDENGNENQNNDEDERANSDNPEDEDENEKTIINNERDGKYEYNSFDFPEEEEEEEEGEEEEEAFE